MKVGISTACFYPEYTEKALERVARMGLHTAELFFNAPSELEPGYIAGLEEIRSANDIEIISVHPFSSGFETMFFFSDYDRRFNDGIDMYKRYFDAMNIFGSRYLILHGAVRTKRIATELYCERLSILGDAARSMGAEVLQENVNRTVSRDPELIRSIHRLLPEQGFALDVKQAVRAGVSPFEMLDAMGDGIRHLHISDNNAICDCLPVGAGEMDFEALLAGLKGVGFDGAVIEELYSTSYSGQEELADSVEKLCLMFC